VMGIRGSADVKPYDHLIPSVAEGYYLRVEEKRIILAANDARGLFYGAQTLRQLARQEKVQSVVIRDYPSVSLRGVVEGFYGNPYSHRDRLSLFEFMGEQKMNFYLYGPKDDAYHRDRWREPYPAEQGQRISSLAAEARRQGVDFVWAIHPGLDIQWTHADSLAIIKKLQLMYDLGVRSFAIFFDDISGQGSNAHKQAALTNYIYEQFIDQHADVKPLIFCPTQYTREWMTDDYIDILGAQTRRDMKIMFTGYVVVNMIEADDAQWVNRRIGRKVLAWLNYPVSDYCVSHLLMGPTYGNSPQLDAHISGLCTNPMEYAEASKVSIFSVADFCWNTRAYQPQQSWNQAIKLLMPHHEQAFRRFCQANIDAGPNYHRFRRDGETPQFRETQRAAQKLLREGDTLAAAQRMKTYFSEMEQAADELLHSQENAPLIEEITPWLQVMKLVAQRGNTLQDMLIAKTQNDRQRLAAQAETYQCLLKEQQAVRSRDFEGSIKHPNPEVATTFVEPYLKEMAKTLELKIEN